MGKNLTVQNLDFDDIKSDLIDFLKGQDKFKDYGFHGSGFDVILDLLSYNTHYMGFFAHMLANESFIDSAYLKSSLTSKAKLVNYIPRSTSSAIAEVVLSVKDVTENPAGNKFLFKRGDIAIASKSPDTQSGDGRKFVLLDDLYVYNKSGSQAVFDYRSDTIDIYEGTFEINKYKVDSSLVNQRFIIHSESVDYRTIRVKVYPSEAEIGSDNFISYKLVNDFLLINGNSPVFFLSVNEDEEYEIFFGKDFSGDSAYGLPVEHGNIVEVSYVEASGEVGNNAEYFLYNGALNENVEFETVTISDGGRDSETLEEMRFNIPNHYRRQNRLVTVDDYKNILLTEYGNISSINVWGGEEHYPKTFGSVYICIKPVYGNVLSSKAKTKIIDEILTKHNVVTVEPILVDADFLFVNLTNKTFWNPTHTDKTAGELVSGIQDVIAAYNDNEVSKFDGYYSNSKLTSKIADYDDSIVSTHNKIQLEKQFIPSLETVQTYYVDFNNPLIPKTFRSDYFEFRSKKSYLTDNGSGYVVIYWWNSEDSVWELYTDETFGTIDYDAGIVRLNSLEIESLYGTYDYLQAFADPVDPDFFPIRNNIVRINSVTYSTEEYYQNES